MAADVKGLIRTALKSDNPTIFINHTALMGIEGEVPDGESDIPFGQADIKRQGADVTAVALSRMVHRTLEAAEIVAKEGIEVEVVDPRTASPLDADTICASVAKTGRMVTVEEAIGPCSIGSEIAATVAEHAFPAAEGTHRPPRPGARPRALQPAARGRHHAVGRGHRGGDPEGGGLRLNDSPDLIEQIRRIGYRWGQSAIRGLANEERKQVPGRVGKA